MGTKKEKIEAEDTRELSREVVGVGRRKKLIGKETNREREKDKERGGQPKRGAILLRFLLFRHIRSSASTVPFIVSVASLA